MIIEIKKPSKKTRLTNDYMTHWRQLAWCARAASKDSYRMVLNHLCVQDGVVVATDGRRLHFTVKQEALKDGRYRILKLGATIWLDAVPDENQFPNWRKVVPSRVENEKRVVGTDDSSIMRLVVAAHDVSGAVFNMDFIEQSIPPGGILQCTVKGIDHRSPLRIDYDDIGTTIVMPMRD